MEPYMKTLAIVQARMGATRLPGKVLADIGGVPMLRRVLDRLHAVPAIDDLVVATTTNPEDDALAAWLTNAGIAFYRGSSDDVLDRFVQAAAGRQAELIVRVTADDPLKDPEITSQVIDILKADTSLDYASNTIEPTWPEGLDIEVVRLSALQRAHREALLKSDREHVTTYIWNRPQEFKLHNLRWDRNLSHWRWTVDKPADLELMRHIFVQFVDRPLVGYREIVDWLERHPYLLTINAGTVRHEGYLKSLEAERQP
jgi:spore coat polysaccharide biosynthesis protein SpsF